MNDNPTREIRRKIARYLRYERNCPVLALECPCRLASTYNNGGAADLLAVDNARQVIEVEIKVSLSDLRADRKKEKHEYFRKLQGMPYKKRKQWRFTNSEKILEPLEYPTHLFYYAFPEEIVNKATIICDDLFPYAGILYPSVSIYGSGAYRIRREFVAVKKKAKPLHPGRISLKQITILTKHQSGTLVRLLDEMYNWKQASGTQSPDNDDKQG